MHQQSETLQKRQHSMWKAISTKSPIDNHSQDFSAGYDAVSACNIKKSLEASNSPFDQRRDSNKSQLVAEQYHSNSNFDK